MQQQQICLLWPAGNRHFWLGIGGERCFAICSPASIDTLNLSGLRNLWTAGSYSKTAMGKSLSEIGILLPELSWQRLLFPHIRKFTSIKNKIGLEQGSVVPGSQGQCNWSTCKIIFFKLSVFPSGSKFQLLIQRFYCCNLFSSSFSNIIFLLYAFFMTTCCCFYPAVWIYFSKWAVPQC